MNDGLKGDLLYPKTLKAAFLVLKGWKPTGREKQHQDNASTARNKNGVAFT